MTLQEAALLTGTSIEIIHPDIRRCCIRHALFDFDGTISLIRQGWQQVMIPMMVEILQAQETGESPAALTEEVTEFVDRLTGKQTIYQMMALRDAVVARDGAPLDPPAYKEIYLDRLADHIADRLAALEEGRVDPKVMMVPGAEEMLKDLRARGVTCYLASGTDEPDVRAEAELLGVSTYFAGIHGAREDYKRHSKKRVIARLMNAHDLEGDELCVFGDGFVEIENAKAVGGIAVGVASDEARREGIDPWKRDRLIRAGADLIIPHFREHETLIGYLFREVDLPEED